MFDLGRLLLISIFFLATSCNVVANGQSCTEEVGEDKSAQLVEWCIEVSPATHPPCNSANACRLIVEEIQRGCAFLKQDEPPPYCLLTYPQESKR